MFIQGYTNTQEAQCSIMPMFTCIIWLVIINRFIPEQNFVILPTPFSYPFRMQISPKFVLNGPLIIRRRWIRWWIGSEQMTNHCLNQWGSSLLRQKRVNRPRWFNSSTKTDDDKTITVLSDSWWFCNLLIIAFGFGGGQMWLIDITGLGTIEIYLFIEDIMC